MDPLTFLKMSFPVQVAIGSGYAAYMLAYTGLRRGMTAIDRAFATIAFSSVSTLILIILTKKEIISSSIFAFLSTVIIGIIWRKFGRTTLKWMVRKLDISWSDESPSAWAHISEDTNHYISQIAVLLDDETLLTCDDTSKFGRLPHGPCLLGDNGDFALYVTHEEKKIGKVELITEMTSVLNEDYGPLLTYIPASKIKRINIRHLKRNTFSL